MTTPTQSPIAIHPVVVSDELVPERRGTVAFFATVTRDGGWTLPRNFRAMALAGNVELDLTRAQVAAGTSEIELRSVMGAVTVLVPPDLRVECEGDAVLGSFEVKRDAPSTTSADAPRVRISGTAVVGSIEVKIVDPNAPGWLDRVRERWKKRSEWWGG